jgi:hypothetical protein
MSSNSNSNSSKMSEAEIFQAEVKAVEEFQKVSLLTAHNVVGADTM